MEYYAVILNRTFLVSVDESHIHGTVCRGLTSVESGVGAARLITRQLSVQGDLNDPNSYLEDRQLNRQNSANFTLNLSEVTAVTYNPRKKWGMGYYPHDGRVFIQTPVRRRELIILGNQSGQEIADRLIRSVGRANNSFKPKPLRGSA
ncbi:hypothetical protein XpiCFBP4643_09625 [Xanthomonas pisi]|uniref:Uncharacterized protein n=2 Tax=Xanthomonas pisi TaxID=56457 RepID=A0A2S7D4R5_9XANT|nr:hypothetical protein XpiCFBP4643_09625 [Xanthomonas pisi]